MADPRPIRLLLLGGTAAMVAGTAFAELLPVVFGVGAAAKAEWSFVYVTLHFVALPALALFLLGASVWSAIRPRRHNQQLAVVPTLSAFVVSVVYLVALALDQGPWARSFVK